MSMKLLTGLLILPECRHKMENHQDIGWIGVSRGNTELPVYHDPGFIGVSNTDGSLLLADGNPDGFTIIFTRQP